MIIGKVITGEGVGKRQGYPTANLSVKAAERVGLKRGVYAGWAWLRGHKYQAAIVIGSKENKVEVHLLNYAGPDFYGELIKVEPIQKVSEMIIAEAARELKAKIGEDIQLIRTCLM